MNSRDYSKNNISLMPFFSMSIRELLLKKNLKIDIFDTSIDSPIVDSPIEQHSAWAFKNIYSIPYPNSEHQNGLARFYHGIQHVSRACMYVPILANLYRKFSYQPALDLDEKSLKLIQIAVLFHDSAREGEEEDLWDHESATFLYFYLIKILKVPMHDAQFLAEAMANKDWSPEKKYYQLLHEHDQISWFKKDIHTKAKTIFHKLIHDADCLDIIRARDSFDGRYLDFYKDIACENPNALDGMSQLIMQARSLIETQGDGRRRTKAHVKIKYECELGYEYIITDIKKSNYNFLHSLYGDAQLLSLDLLSKINLIDENNILNTTLIFARGIITPSAIAKRYLKNRNKMKASEPRETMAKLEFRKMKRRPGILTGTSKGDGLLKDGNPNRSVSRLGYGGGVFADAGCLIFNPDQKRIKSISLVDSDTGWRKKRGRHNSSKLTGYYINSSGSGYLSNNLFCPTRFSTLKELEHNMKIGISVRHFQNNENPASHTEIEYHVREYDAVYYTFDPTFANAVFHGDSESQSQYSPILKAIYIQYEYYKACGKMLPIYEYSAIHNYLKLVPSFTDKQIINMWVEMYSSYIKENLLSGVYLYDIRGEHIDYIKIFCLYRSMRRNSLFRKVISADRNYPKYLKGLINDAINMEMQKIIEKEEDNIFDNIINDRILLGENNAYFNIITSERLLKKLKLFILEKLSVFKDNFNINNFNNINFTRILKLAYFSDIEILSINEIAASCINEYVSSVKLSKSFELDLLNNIAIFVCFFKLELQPILSDLNIFRWHHYFIAKLDSRECLYWDDFEKMLERLNNQSGLIDLSFINIITVSNGKSKQVFSLNKTYKENKVDKTSLAKYFKPADISTENMYKNQIYKR